MRFRGGPGLAAMAAVMLAGCASVPELGGDEPARPKPAAAKPRPAAPQALGAREVRALLTGNSVYAASAEVKFAALHAADGRLRGKAWAGDGTATGAGSWKIEADGRYCRKWDNGWAGGEWGCFRLYRQGNAVTMEKVSGAGANGSMTLVPGNAYGL